MMVSLRVPKTSSAPTTTKNIRIKNTTRLEGPTSTANIANTTSGSRKRIFSTSSHNQRIIRNLRNTRIKVGNERRRHGGLKVVGGKVLVDSLAGWRRPSDSRNDDSSIVVRGRWTDAASDGLACVVEVDPQRVPEERKIDFIEPCSVFEKKGCRIRRRGWNRGWWSWGRRHRSAMAMAPT